VFNHSSAAVINNQTFLKWFLDDYMFNEIGGSSLATFHYWDDTWTPSGIGFDPVSLHDAGLKESDLLQLTASYKANMDAAINRTIDTGRFAWQLMQWTYVSMKPAASGKFESCKALLKQHCQLDALVQHSAVLYYTGYGTGYNAGTRIRQNFTDCSAFGCTCKGAGNYYGIGGGKGNFGCTDTGAQTWWVEHHCPQTAYASQSPPYAGCEAAPLDYGEFGQDLANFLLVRGAYAWFGYVWMGCSEPTADVGGGWPFPPQYNTDFGTPLGVCHETEAGSGVFRREWTNAEVEMDCNIGKPSIVMKS
jgi:hypothetical protein